MATTMMAASMTSLVAPAGLRAGRLPTQAALPLRRRALQAVRVQQSPKPPADPTEEDMTVDTTPSSSPANNTKPGLLDALAFSGPGPERINGRLAMVGFVSALAVEASRGVGLLSQAGDGAGLTWFAYTAVVLSAASLAPLLQGESVEGRSGGFWNADAELWNGRLAMVGLVALAATEYLTGSPLISA